MQLRSRSRGSDESLTDSERSMDPLTWRQRFQMVLMWIVTVDGDEDLTRKNKNYVPMSNLTNYVFFLGGRFRTVQNKKQFSLMVLFIILIPMILFSIFETAKIWRHDQGYKSLVVLFYYFWVMTLSSFIIVGTTDPGVLPKNIHVPQLTRNYQVPQEYYNIINLPTTHANQNYPTTPLQLKYCRSCRIWRPPRASHCSTCECCIMVHDHHCIWINNCVGQRNYRYFITFLIGATLSSVFLIANSAIHLHRKHNVHDTPVSVLLIVWGSLTIWYPAILLIYHIFMTGTQQTTREYLHQIGSKNPVMHRITANKDNIFDTHHFAKNMALLMAEVRGPQLINPRDTHHPGDWRFMKLP